VNDLRHDPDAIDPAAERTAFLRQWQPVPDGVAPWGRTVMHHDGSTYVNVDPPADWQGVTWEHAEPPTLDPPDLRTAGEKLDELASTVEAERINLRLLLQRVEVLERAGQVDV